MAHAKEFRAEQPCQYRALPGNRNERLRIMKEMRAMIGQIVTLDRIGAELSVAIEEERNEKMERIILMRENGRSHREISQELGIPTSTVRRYMQSYQKSPATVNRDPAMVHNFPRRPSGGPQRKFPFLVALRCLISPDVACVEIRSVRNPLWSVRGFLPSALWPSAFAEDAWSLIQFLV
jgi:hypothetical protein